MRADGPFKIFDVGEKWAPLLNLGLPPKPALRGAYRRAPQDSPALSLRAIARWSGRVSEASVHTAKCRRLGGAFATGFEPLVSNRLLSAIFECGLEAM